MDFARTGAGLLGIKSVTPRHLEIRWTMLNPLWIVVETDQVIAVVKVKREQIQQGSAQETGDLLAVIVAPDSCVQRGHMIQLLCLA